MLTSTWTEEDSKLHFRECVKSLLEHMPHNHIMEVDHQARKAWEDLASPSQGWLVLWVQLFEDPHLYAAKIKFDHQLKNILLDVANKDGRYLECTFGFKVIRFLFEFTMQPVNVPPLKVRPGKESLAEIAKGAA